MRCPAESFPKPQSNSLKRHKEHRALPSPRSIIDTLARFLTERWEQTLHQREITILHPGPDEIHDLRVASRRLRAAIEQLEPFIGAEPVRRMKRPARRLTRILGDLRNLDEALLYFEQFDPLELQPLLAPLARQRGKDVRLVGNHLEELDTRKLDRRINHAVNKLATRIDGNRLQEILATLAERSRQLYLPIHELLPDSTGPGQIEQRHHLRIAIKKWRYCTELLAGMLDRDQSDLLEQLRRYQTVLGDMNNLQVFRTMLPKAKKLPATVRLTLLQRLAADHNLLLADYRELTRRHPLHYAFPA